MITESELIEDINRLVEKKRNGEYSSKAEKKALTESLEAKRLQLQEIMKSGS